MPPKPLTELSLLDHKSALWWLGILYCRPKYLMDALEELPPAEKLTRSALLLLTALPYILLVCAIGCVALTLLRLGTWNWPDLLSDEAILVATGIATGSVAGIAAGAAMQSIDYDALLSAVGTADDANIGPGPLFALAFFFIVGISGRIATGFAGGFPLGIPRSITFGIAFGVAFGIAYGIMVRIAFAVAVSVTFGITCGIIAGIVNGIGDADLATGFAVGLAVGISALTSLLRPYYLLRHVLFLWPRIRPRRYPLHPVAWDDLCSTFPCLARLLVAYAELSPVRGNIEIERLIAAYPCQRSNAIRALTIILARESGLFSSLSQLSGIGAKLPEGKNGFLTQTPQVRNRLDEIARQQLRLDTIDRPALREPLALNLLHEIENFRSAITGFEDPLRTEFRAAALNWEAIARRQLDGIRGALDRRPVRQLFRAGDPVNREAEAFVVRDSVVGDLDQQITLAGGCPGIVLYGRRRMGKTTLLTNLAGFLPESIDAVTLSLQDPRAFTSLEYLVTRIARTLPPRLLDGPLPCDLPTLQQTLDVANARLQSENRRLILAIDEYENLDLKIGQGVFPTDLLHALRDSIQSHRRITWLFAGSHEITQLANAHWTSYLVSARTIEVTPFTLQETRVLLTEPLKHSTAWKSPADRPRFSPGFWGENGIERIHSEADGWPHLLQLIAETAVDLVNYEGVASVTPALFHRALDKAVTSGHNVLSELMQGESTLPSEWDYVAAFRTHDVQPPPSDPAIRRSLRGRQIIREENGDWRLRVPIMARWLKLRA
jgi:hypothetical protein